MPTMYNTFSQFLSKICDVHIFYIFLMKHKGETFFVTHSNRWINNTRKT